MNKTRKSLWMRYVDFSKIRDALHLISERDGQLRAKDLEILGIKSGIFRRKNGKPFSRTTMYHYRKVMEHLQLVKTDKQRYFMEGAGQFAKVLEREDRLQGLSLDEKEVFANAIVRNSDCQSYFFNIFSLAQKRFTSLKQFRTEASYIIVQTDERGTIVLRNPRTEACYVLNTNDELQAIFWGVRLWALDLEITDEIFTYTEGRVIFPILQRGSMKTTEIVWALLRELKPTQTWETFSVPELTRKWAPSLRLSTQELHDAIKAVQVRYPQFVDLMPTSTSFIDIRTPFSTQDGAFFKGYLKDSQGRFISHIRLHCNIWEEYKYSNIKEKQCTP